MGKDTILLVLYIFSLLKSHRKMCHCLAELEVKIGIPSLKQQEKSRLTWSILYRTEASSQEHNQYIMTNLFSNTTDLTSHICSRIPDANHNHSLPHKIVRILVLPTMEILASELRDPCEEG
jgi:hypothetical protein